MFWDKEFDDKCIAEYSSVLQEPVYLEVNKGWHHIITKMLTNLKALNEEYTPLSVKVVDIKQKYCTLRVSWYLSENNEFTMLDTDKKRGLWNKADTAIRAAEYESIDTCEFCGKIEADIKAEYLNLCKDCRKKYEEGKQNG